MNRAQRRQIDKRMSGASTEELKAEIRALKAQNDAMLAEMQDYLVAQKGVDIQQAMDFLAIAAHEEFGFGEKRNHRLQTAFNRVFLKYMKMSCEDFGLEKKQLTAREIHLGMRPDMKYGDEDTTYTHVSLDRDLKAAVGKYFIPYEKRYEIENLYNRDRDALHRKVEIHDKAKRQGLLQREP